MDLAEKGKIKVNLPLIIVKGAGKAALFGMQWFEHIKFNWQKVCCVQGSVSGVLEKHTVVFGEGLGMPKGTTAKIYVESDQPSKFLKQRTVPYALKRKVEEELDRSMQTKVIVPVLYSDLATSSQSCREGSRLQIDGEPSRLPFRAISNSSCLRWMTSMKN